MQLSMKCILEEEDHGLINTEVEVVWRKMGKEIGSRDSSGKIALRECYWSRDLKGSAFLVAQLVRNLPAVWETWV